MNVIDSKVDLIREVFHYQSRFEGSIMVFKIDYPVTEDPGFPGLVKDLALLSKTGFKVIIVPGVKENIDAVFKQHDINSSYTNSLQNTPIRITTQEAISFVEMAAFDVASRFMTFLSGSRVDALIGNFVRARGLGVINGIDTEYTGTVDKIYAESLSRVLNLGMVPILPCIGWSPSGKPYNVASDEIALAASTALGAIKLFIVSVKNDLGFKTLTLPEGIETRNDGSLIRLTPAQAETIINSNSVPMRELKLALQASKKGVHRVHIIDGREEGAVLKELFSNLGVGTMIYTDEYDSIRAIHSRDLPDILRLMEPLMQKGALIRRNLEQIQEKKEDYSVLEIDGSIRACGALHDWGESQGEIAAIATDPQYSDIGLGRKIVGFLAEKARKNRMRRVFVLTTQTQDWFESMGFREAPVDSLPEQKRKVYDQNRNSKVFALEL
ncbi:MAG: amino-acid N-acetyltransferase [Treponema sp.]|nr:amino-acid N-acetyltransferase [Treponema sp.]MCL2272706.1 amino-acid N-acetyltransferase [Treponema sp.]